MVNYFPFSNFWRSWVKPFHYVFDLALAPGSVGPVMDFLYPKLTYQDEKVFTQVDPAIITVKYFRKPPT